MAEMENGSENLTGGTGEQTEQNQATLSNSETVETGGQQNGEQGGQQNQTPATQYQDFQIPDEASATVTSDPGVMKDFSALAAKYGLSQEAAQEFVNLGAKSMHRAISSSNDAIIAKLDEIKHKWHREAENDPTITESLKHAQRVVQKFGNDELSKMFNETGVGSNPAMIKFLIRVGEAMGESPLLMGGQGGAQKPDDFKSIASKMYDGKM